MCSRNPRLNLSILDIQHLVSVSSNHWRDFPNLPKVGGEFTLLN